MAHHFAYRLLIVNGGTIQTVKTAIKEWIESLNMAAAESLGKGGEKTFTLAHYQNGVGVQWSKTDPATSSRIESIITSTPLPETIAHLGFTKEEVFIPR